MSLAVFGRRLTFKRSDSSVSYTYNVCLQGLTIKEEEG